MPGKVTQHFAEETTVHAVKDFYYATGIGKIFWGILVIVAVVGLTLQLQGVIYQYVHEEVGATMTEYFPPNLPAISICPDRWISAAKAEKYALTAKSASVLNGFMLTRGTNQLVAFQSENSYEVEAAIINAGFGYKDEYERMLKLWLELGGTLDGLMENLAMDELNTLFADVYPLGAEVERSRLINMGGVCYKYKGLLTVNAIQSSYAGMKIAFRMGGELVPDVGVTPPFFEVALDAVDEKSLVSSSDITFQYGRHYLILYKVTKVNMINTKMWPCRMYTLADKTHCSFVHGNEVAKGLKGVLTPAGCETAIPSSPTFPATKTDVPCNTFVDVKGSALFPYVNLSYTDQQWTQICARPCTVTTYEYTVQMQRTLYDPMLTDNLTYTIIETKAAKGRSGTGISEYLIMSTSNMLSNVGGTLGLWIGASVMSLFQALYIFGLQRLIEKGSCSKKKKATAPAAHGPKN